ncbi:hypothetical protein Taro_019289 [Colocasia esculenta]|uniref:Large ribosomal subunit protein uL15/eL18 domain-containing protein n=1 Tax=Colocasia esculenta TaxID=4460 RepID=A0A843UYS6_COLES|nr:hypothetical protein [Colocasia esculenta]
MLYPRPTRRNLVEEEISEFLYLSEALDNTKLSPGMKDSKVWKWERSGKFSVKSVVRLLIQGGLKGQYVQKRFEERVEEDLWKLCLPAMLWSIWKERNKRLFNQEFRNLFLILNDCMHAGLPKFVPVNLKDIEAAGFQEGEEVSLESLKEKGLINPSGRERSLPLKVLGDGELSVKLSIKARAFSAAAKGKLEAAGCTLTVLPGRKKWVKPSVAKNIARAEEYFAKKRAAAGSESA